MCIIFPLRLTPNCCGWRLSSQIKSSRVKQRVRSALIRSVAGESHLFPLQGMKTGSLIIRAGSCCDASHMSFLPHNSLNSCLKLCSLSFENAFQESVTGLQMTLYSRVAALDCYSTHRKPSRRRCHRVRRCMQVVFKYLTWPKTLRHLYENVVGVFHSLWSQ